jgi:hypothetical protein
MLYSYTLKTEAKRCSETLKTIYETASSGYGTSVSTTFRFSEIRFGETGKTAVTQTDGTVSAAGSSL